MPKWPVSKVTTLLKDMLKQMEKEAEEDEEIYDKVACWCETNDKEMTQAIKDDKDRIAYLTVKIPELGALVGQLTAELAFIDKKTITVTARGHLQTRQRGQCPAPPCGCPARRQCRGQPVTHWRAHAPAARRPVGTEVPRRLFFRLLADFGGSVEGLGMLGQWSRGWPRPPWSL